MKPCALIAVGVSLCFTSCSRSNGNNVPTLPEGVTIESQLPEGTSWASILLEASNLGNLTRPPQRHERSLMFSSSVDPGKACLAYLAPEVLGDADHGFFLSVSNKPDCVEATLADIEGPGAITWIWSANPAGQIAFFADDSKTPVIEMPFRALLTGGFLPCKYPFASLTANGYNLSFPIVHKRRLKVVLTVKDKQELAGLFYQIAWNALDSAIVVHPFDSREIARSGPLLGSLAARFTAKQAATAPATRPVTVSLDLPAGTGQPFLETQTNGILQSLVITAPSKQALSGLWIQAYWDRSAVPAMMCPASMLVGVSEKCEDTRSFPSSLIGNAISVRWPMPFGAGSRMLLRNDGTTAVKALVTTEIVDQDDTTSLLRFHANYTRHEYLDLRRQNVLSLAEVHGRGRIVQCAIRIDSRSDKWWGEGDHIIWLDRTDEPAWQGTGTEDYFGFAWCSNELFEHPFRSQTRADGSQTKRRIASMHRAHLLDTLPFHQWAKFEMEAWGLGEGYMDYETSVIWYSDSNDSLQNWR